MISVIAFSKMLRSPLAPVFLSIAFLRDGRYRLFFDLQFHVIQLKQLFVLL